MGSKYSICESCQMLIVSKKSKCSLCELFWKIFNSNNILEKVYINESNTELFLVNSIPFSGNTFKYTPKEVIYFYCYDIPGSYWFLDKIGLKDAAFMDIATPEKKTKTNIKILAIPNGIFFITGIIKPDRIKKEGDKYLNGGGRQFYIPKCVVDSILPISDKFLKTIKDKANLILFTNNIKLALTMQEVWWQEYETGQVDRLTLKNE